MNKLLVGMPSVEVNSKATSAKIKALRKKQGRSATWLAKQIGMERSTYYMKERGERPWTLAEIQRCEEALA